MPEGLASLSMLMLVFCLSTSYIDPEAVVGCEDGTARVFDMYSKTCSQIIRYDKHSVLCCVVSYESRLQFHMTL